MPKEDNLFNRKKEMEPTSKWSKYRSESRIKFWPTWNIHRGTIRSIQSPKFLGKAHINLLLPGLTGTQIKIRATLFCGICDDGSWIKTRTLVWGLKHSQNHERKKERGDKKEEIRKWIT